VVASWRGSGQCRAERYWESLGYIQTRTREGMQMGKLTNTVRVMVKPLAGGTIEEFLSLVPRDRQRDRVRSNRRRSGHMAHFPKLLRDLPHLTGLSTRSNWRQRTAMSCLPLTQGHRHPATQPRYRECRRHYQGELILILDGRETRYRAGEWYHVRAKATHAARFDVETSEIEFWFHLQR